MESLLKFIFPAMFKARPLSATIEGWDEWEERARDEFPIAHFVVYKISRPIGRFVYRQKRRLNDFKYWFLYRLHPEHKYHLVNTGLKPNYHEYDTRLVEAILYTTKTFVDDAKQVISWSGKERWHKAFDQAYAWYTHDRPFLLSILKQKEDEMHALKSPDNLGEFMKWLNTEEAAPYNELLKEIEEGEDMIRKENKKHCINVLKYNEYMWY